jgi:cytochrome P450
MEGRIALGTLLARFPDLRLENPKVHWTGNFTFRALRTLPVRWTVESSTPGR